MPHLQIEKIFLLEIAPYHTKKKPKKNTKFSKLSI